MLDMVLKPTQTDDLQTDSNLKRIDDLETFKKGFEGKELDAKVCNAIKDSVPLQTEIKSLIWGVIKDKMVWIVGLIVLFLATNFISSLVSKMAEKVVK